MFTKIFWSQVTFGTIMAPKTNNKAVIIKLVINQGIMIYLMDCNHLESIDHHFVALAFFK
jgi:hypothetical protein